MKNRLLGVTHICIHYMCVYIYIKTYIHTHIYIHTYIHTFIHANIYINMYTLLISFFFFFLLLLLFFIYFFGHCFFQTNQLVLQVLFLITFGKRQCALPNKRMFFGIKNDTIYNPVNYKHKNISLKINYIKIEKSTFHICLIFCTLVSTHHITTQITSDTLRMMIMRLGNKKIHYKSKLAAGKFNLCVRQPCHTVL